MSCCTPLRLACLGLIVSLAGALPAAGKTRRVVVLYDEHTYLPGLSVLDTGLVRELTSGSPEPVEVFRESMDLSRFGSDAYLLLLRDHLRAKYAGMKIDVAVAVMSPALDFLLSHGEAVFPGARIVFCGISRRSLGGRPLPPQVTGVLLKREFSPTLEVALRLHPDTERVVFVGGTGDFDASLVEQARAELRAYEDRLAFRYLTALPMHELLTELSRLPPRTLVLYSALFRDGAGQPFVPHDVAERVAAAANAPVYGFVDQFLGRGIVGGYLYSLDRHGEAAARLVLKVLAGAEPSRLAPVEIKAGRMMFDSRQLQRWGVSERRLPPEAIVRFRQASFWSQYWAPVTATAAIVALQALMIGSLLLQRSRRRRAESELHESERRSRSMAAELAHLTRVATMGEITASLAHELKQPLGAILSNAEAAEMLLATDPPVVDEVREILDDIRADDRRAGEIVRGMRSFLEKHEVARKPIEINGMLEDVLRLIKVEAAEQKVAMSLETPREPRHVAGDRVHLQQVLVNLILNSFEAMATVPEDGRRLVVRTRCHDGTGEIAVCDTGPGIPDEILPRVFEPFWTTKKNGLGIGLSISRTIVEAHEGRISAENNDPGPGATFRIALPLLAEGGAR